MTIWFVHRTAGTISWAGQYEQSGYADEQLDDANSAELRAFLNPPATPDQVLATKLASGMVLTSSGTSAINGTYAFDKTTQDDLSGIAATIGLLGTFPDGTTSGYQYPQLGGQAVTTFASIAAFRTMYAPYAKLLQQLRTQGAILAAGGTPVWPSQSVTVA